MERPASTAIPTRPAAWAPSTLLGPMAGRSARNSWPGLAHLTSTPRLLAAPQRGDNARQHRDQVETPFQARQGRPPLDGAGKHDMARPYPFQDADKTAELLEFDDFMLELPERRFRPHLAADDDHERVLSARGQAERKIGR